MVGCMLESSLANTAAAIVATWADYCDLDGHKLIADDPFDGLKIREDGRIILNDRHGLGVLPIL
jgi:L-alanine-DL-glutamate epimerase-like enolase superfamily enzyme